jgi:hypothetical protein
MINRALATLSVPAAQASAAVMVILRKPSPDGRMGPPHAAVRCVLPTRTMSFVERGAQQWR